MLRSSVRRHRNAGSRRGLPSYKTRVHPTLRPLTRKFHIIHPLMVVLFRISHQKKRAILTWWYSRKTHPLVLSRRKSRVPFWIAATYHQPDERLAFVRMYLSCHADVSSKNRLTSGGLDNRTIISKLVDVHLLKKWSTYLLYRN